MNKENAHFTRTLFDKGVHEIACIHYQYFMWNEKNPFYLHSTIHAYRVYIEMILPVSWACDGKEASRK